MHRRVNIQSGHVHFPMHLESSREGGMFVRLWVIDTADGVGECCSTHIFHEIHESFIGSDITKQKQVKAAKKIQEIWDQHLDTNEKLLAVVDEERRLLAESTQEILFRNDQDSTKTSLPLVADILMGSTGWSNSEFICEYKDLTELGKAMYNTISAMYPQCKVALVTFLDT